jgi:hypothetical protein
MTRSYEGVGFFEQAWKNPPAPFNPLFDPKAKDRFAAVTKSMEADNFYASHSREECRAEWRRRYDEREAADAASRN